MISRLSRRGSEATNVPDDGSDVGVELSHQDARAHNQDVQAQNMEEAERQQGRRSAELNSGDVRTTSSNISDWKCFIILLIFSSVLSL